MSRITYFLKRVFKMDYHRMWATTKVIREMSQKSRLFLMKDMLTCAVKYNAGYMDYKIARMWELSDAQRKTVITRGISNNIVRRMNDKAYWHFFDDKAQFNETFKKWVRRDWLEISEKTDPEALASLLEKHDTLIGKPLEGSSGVGIQKYTKDDWKDGAQAFLQKLIQDGIGILEEVVV